CARQRFPHTASGLSTIAGRVASSASPSSRGRLRCPRSPRFPPSARGRGRAVRPRGGTMEQVVTQLPAVRAARSARVVAVSLLGPLTVLAGVVWAFVQPDRLTLLHPRGQGFWWLVIEAPLLVALAGVFFALVVARPLVKDLEERSGAA